VAEKVVADLDQKQTKQFIGLRKILELQQLLYTIGEMG
jgi:hypothetical protein